jgi:SAM-dependent methyltransferase
MVTAPCGICGASARLQFRGHPAYQAPATFDIFHCSNCETRFAAPMVADAGLYDLIYENAAHVPGYERYVRYREALKSARDALAYLASQEDVYWSVGEALRLLEVPKTACRILEVGSGFGYLTYALHQAGYDCRGIDLSARAVSAARRDFGDLYAVADLMQLASACAEGYDVVIATELIEHVPAPAAFVQWATRLLKPGGCLILSTPNQELYSERYVWHTDPAPVHLWWFSRTSLRSLAWQHGMTVRFVDFSAFYGGRTWPSHGQTKPQTFDRDGVVIFRDGLALRLARACVARLPGLFRPLARLYIGTRTLGRWRSAPYRDSLSLCAVMRKDGAAP